MPLTIAELSSKSREIREIKRRILSAYKKLGLADSAPAHPTSDLQVRGVFAGLSNLAIDLAAVSGASKRATSQSTNSERKALIVNADELVSSLAATANVLENFYAGNYKSTDPTSLTVINASGQAGTPDFLDLLTRVDALKLSLRPFTIRFTSEHADAIAENLADLARRASTLETLLLKAQEDVGNIQKSYDESQKLVTAAQESFGESEEKRREIEKLLESSETSAGTINSKLAEVQLLYKELKATAAAIEATRVGTEGHQEIVELFTKKISTREIEIVNQSAKSENFEKQLVFFASEQQRLIQESALVVEEAKKALNISSEVSLGRHFATQYAEEAESVHLWLWGAAISAAIGLSIGIWAILTPGSDVLVAFLTRLSLVPIALASAIFCALQYSKQKRLIADYAYKKVLALSLTGFREHFSSDGESQWKELAPKILSEIHTHPFSDRAPNSSGEDKTVASILERIATKVAEKIATNK